MKFYTIKLPKILGGVVKVILNTSKKESKVKREKPKK
ncbi:stage V sporulation protein SpoVM [Mechercharimyces sp. CAU 1602]|nr:stage V sporulation protein SpoVM [Mechercharimyces sp. CAU 1602]MCS1351384.1 stage V sporulation protein SpoVM [Mechercharimyces sp. CAU 1602]